jgi:SAM-dependent methyltransferase
MIVSLILKNQLVWNLCQYIFGADQQKKILYRSLIPKTGRLLDFGCANGNTYLAFTEFQYTGVDIDPIVINFARKQHGRRANAEFICADILDGSLPRKHYDYVLFAGTGHHIPNDELPNIIRALARTLKKRGRLYFIDPIRDERRRSAIVNALIAMDQGKFYKNQEYYLANLPKFSPDLKMVRNRMVILHDTFLPQPTYFIGVLEKK